MKYFSIVVPTYTGKETIGNCIRSIASQKTSKKYDVVIIQDGPNEQLTKKIRKALPILDKRNIQYTFKILEKNEGRFEARRIGAKSATHKDLLFLDDRIEFDDSYFDAIANFNEDASIPNVIERPANNFISRVLYLLRKNLVYRNQYEEFESAHITKENFESMPKGTTSLWIKRQIFLDACDNLHEPLTKYTNEDTKLFKALVESGTIILRNSQAKIYYTPRLSSKAELKHLYERGPRFVDYYLKSGTRFFYPLVFLIIALIGMPLFLIWAQSLILPLLLALGLLDIIFGLLLARSFRDFVTVLISLPLVVSVMILGVINGLFKKLMGRR